MTAGQRLGLNKLNSDDLVWRPLLANRYLALTAAPTMVVDPSGEGEWNPTQILHASVSAAIVLAIGAVAVAVPSPLGPVLLDVQGVAVFSLAFSVPLTITIGVIWELVERNPRDVREDLVFDALGAMAGAFIWLAITGIFAPRNRTWAAILAGGGSVAVLRIGTALFGICRP